MTRHPDRRTMIGGSIGLLAASALGNSAFAEGQAPVPVPTPRRGFGWVRDLPSPNDQVMKALPFTNPARRPPKIDLSAKLPPAYDQKELGSCTANAIAGAVQFARRAHNKPGDFIPSRLFIYYQERKIENRIYTDSGAQLRDGITAVSTYGVCDEKDWPYDAIAGDPQTGVFPQGARAITAPPADIMAKAQPFKTISASRLDQDATVLESCLAGGYPFVFGFSVFDNFDVHTKLLRKPGPNDHITPEGHAVLATGYDQAKRTFRIRNSWGPTANDAGYFDMDYDYVLNPGLAADFWVIYQTLGFI